MTEQQTGIYGIDLGTTYSVVGYIDETGRANVIRNNQSGDDTTPSVVYFENEENVVVGKAAKEAAGVEPKQVVSLIKREMGNRDYLQTFFGSEHTPPSISAIILSALAREAEQQTGSKVTDVVITVPAYFGLLEKDATRKAGEIAGLNVIGIVPEPVAAAFQYGVTGRAEGTTVLVYDLGGGTFDVSLIRLTDTAIEVLVVDGDHQLGGADWDAKLLEHIVDQTVAACGDDSLRDDEEMLQNLRIAAEETKKALSTAESKTQIVRYTGSPAKIVITRGQFEELTADLLDDTIRITKRTLETAEEKYPGITKQISDVLLVGGSSKMPAVTAALSREFGWSPKLADPDLAVAKGAALYAAGQTVRYVDPETGAVDTTAGAQSEDGDQGTSALAMPRPVTDEAVQAVADQTGLSAKNLRDLAQRTVINVLPKAVGVKLVDTDKPGWEDDIESASYIHHLVEAQTQLPHKAEPFVASTVVANQQEIAIEIWEQAGAAPAAELSANHALDSSAKITSLQTFALPADSPVNIEMNIDDEGTVNMRAFEPTSGKEVTVSVRISILSEEQVSDAKRILTGLKVST
ncbi:MAG TPA: Hsp70 family protein [Streptosporangiaceae bacterium]|nr:Hsp70 family protein [Streptosporangiaceae bacterium]